ncbi:hypothetical protein GVN16_22550 [Emticicia sp. CRIBPO]|uniref:hypothetical protein n=1 Tax=Emticicia sp. CRIBPO TaxID=2683258 RepID=UPI0014124612|nr:hypothetical protein [Emticicia sp. CRIBPO]NBA88572.1 hypothetical protein [Emticicia sp. CRIBPO]
MKNHRNETRGIVQKTVMLSIILFISFISKAQLTQNKVVEFVINGDINDEYNLAPLKKDGLLIVNPQSSYYGRDSKVNFMKLDTSLNFIWKSTYKVALGYKFEKYFQNEKYVYSLFRETDRLNISIVRVDYATGDRVVTDTKLLTKMDIGYFTVVGSKAIIGGTYNDRPVVEMISLFDQTAKVLPQLHTNHLRINSIEVNEANALIYVMLSDQRNCKFTLSIYDYEGRSINSKILGEKNKVIINGKLLTLPDNQLILAGNFADNCTNYSSGFYLYPLLNDQKIKYFDFADLDNFFSYLSEKKQKKIRMKMLARKERGKENKIRHRLLLHDIQTDKQGITFTAEVYYPEYKSSPNLSLNSIRTLGLNTPLNSSYNNYRFTHAIICDFDFSGNLKWDYSIGLNNLESAFLEEKVQLTKIDDKYLLAFPDENLIKTELVARNRKDKESYNLDLKQNSKKNSDDFSSELSSWYANTFVAYGMKTTRAEGGLNTKDVFYLSKLSYNPVDSKKLLD